MADLFPVSDTDREAADRHPTCMKRDRQPGRLTHSQIPTHTHHRYYRLTYPGLETDHVSA